MRSRREGGVTGSEWSRSADSKAPATEVGLVTKLLVSFAEVVGAAFRMETQEQKRAREMQW